MIARSWARSKQIMIVTFYIPEYACEVNARDLVQTRETVS